MLCKEREDETSEEGRGEERAALREWIFNQIREEILERFSFDASQGRLLGKVRNLEEAKFCTMSWLISKEKLVL